METLEATHSISADTAHTELHFTIGGLWNEETMRSFLFDLGEAAKPFMRDRTPFTACGDLRAFVPQNQETAAAIRESLMAAKSNGLTRFAVITSSALLKLQYKRITEGLEVEFFEEPRDALAWLRR